MIWDDDDVHVTSLTKIFTVPSVWVSNEPTKLKSVLCTMTSSNGNIFRIAGLCVGNSPVTGDFPTQRPVTRSFDAFFDLRLNQQLSKQWGRWWFETPSRLLWRHCNECNIYKSVDDDVFENTVTMKVLCIHIDKMLNFSSVQRSRQEIKWFVMDDVLAYSCFVISSFCLDIYM